MLASTLTTIAVFLPVVFMEEEVGQLFGDIALAISCAVGTEPDRLDHGDPQPVGQDPRAVGGSVQAKAARLGRLDVVAGGLERRGRSGLPADGLDHRAGWRWSWGCRWRPSR